MSKKLIFDGYGWIVCWGFSVQFFIADRFLWLPVGLLLYEWVLVAVILGVKLTNILFKFVFFEGKKAFELCILPQLVSWELLLYRFFKSRGNEHPGVEIFDPFPMRH